MGITKLYIYDWLINRVLSQMAVNHIKNLKFLKVKNLSNFINRARLLNFEIVNIDDLVNDTEYETIYTKKINKKFCMLVKQEDETDVENFGYLSVTSDIVSIYFVSEDGFELLCGSQHKDKHITVDNLDLSGINNKRINTDSPFLYDMYIKNNITGQIDVDNTELKFYTLTKDSIKSLEKCLYSSSGKDISITDVLCYYCTVAVYGDTLDINLNNLSTIENTSKIRLGLFYKTHKNESYLNIKGHNLKFKYPIELYPMHKNVSSAFSLWLHDVDIKIKLLDIFAVESDMISITNSNIEIDDLRVLLLFTIGKIKHIDYSNSTINITENNIIHLGRIESITNFILGYKYSIGEINLVGTKLNIDNTPASYNNEVNHSLDYLRNVREKSIENDIMCDDTVVIKYNDETSYILLELCKIIYKNIKLIKE